MGINYSTAKSVLNTFRNQGRIDKKRFRSKKGSNDIEMTNKWITMRGEKQQILGRSTDLDSMKSITVNFAVREEKEEQSLSYEEKQSLHTYVYGSSPSRMGSETT